MRNPKCKIRNAVVNCNQNKKLMAGPNPIKTFLIKGSRVSQLVFSISSALIYKCFLVLVSDQKHNSLFDIFGNSI